MSKEKKKIEVEQKQQRLKMMNKLKKELKRLKQIATRVSVGNKIYFASQVVAVVNNELDYRGI